ncbi:MAG: hypothetical protein AAFY65_10180 [Pseudomonadota bacterium]
MKRFCMWATALAVIATPALAEWRWEQGGGLARTETRANGYQFFLSCEVGRTNEIYLDIIADGQDPDLASAQVAMLWIQLPDGRLDRQPVDLNGTPKAAGGFWFVSSSILDNFRNATAMEVELYPQRKTLAKLSMRGSGASRLAFQEQCGF